MQPSGLLLEIFPEGQEIDGQEDATQADDDEGRLKVNSVNRRREDEPPLQAGDGGTKGDPKVLEEHGAADREAPLLAFGERNRSGLQGRSQVPEHRCCRPVGSR
ncbi:hypothetical protein MRB53_033357 [Persea americana]|uniref:Uncharacterized protein n=1 Tax=Persea americana TaxID=3435 RepID=A0ACC2KVI1_PERAE|nr:hypothetical protein MRB53_033357 [Persea americana]